MITIRLPDGRQFETPAGTNAAAIAQTIGPGLAKAAIAAKVDGQIIDLSRPIDHDTDLRIITLSPNDPDALHVLRHSCAHVMAEAICELFPETKLVYGPPVENGFYYDIDLDRPLSTEDFAAIEKRMGEIIKEDRPFTRYEMSRDQAMPKLEKEGNPYKIENAIAAQGDTLSFYVTGQRIGEQFEDLCRGPHLPSTGKIPAFKVMSVAGAYFHGDAKNKQLQRVYGTAFASKKDLDAYLHQLEEAKKRDHRILGKQLGLFAIDDVVGPGLVLWKPAGAIIRQELQNFIADELRKQGYQQVFTPHIGRLALYRTSGHFPYYQDSQYPPLIDREALAALAGEGCSCGELANRLDRGDIDGYLLKPMNCPHHIRIYSSDQHSYRDLPIRLAEFGTVYRYEQSGEIGGLTRVRGFTQDDAHLFCTEQQLADELQGCLALVKIIFSTLQMTDYRVRVGLRDASAAKYVGAAENWDKAEAACRAAAASLGVDFTEERGEAAFYGPKIDFVVKDVLGRSWQLGTVQVDYNLPERFGLEYIGPDNQPHRPVMIHRAPFGAMERFVGVLIEHFAGNFPLWLAPVQARVLTISERFNDYARRVAGQMRQAGIRVELDDGSEKIGAKIRAATVDKVPYMLIVGEQEQAEERVAVRHRTAGQQGTFSVAQVIAGITEEIGKRTVRT